MMEVDPGEVEHADTWAFTRCAVPASRQHEVQGVAQVLAGHVAEYLFGVAGSCDTEDHDSFSSPFDGAVQYITNLRRVEGEDGGDFGGAWTVLEYSFDLPKSEDGYDNEVERESAFEWAVRFTCRASSAATRPDLAGRRAGRGSGRRRTS